MRLNQEPPALAGGIKRHPTRGFSPNDFDTEEIK